MKAVTCPLYRVHSSVLRFRRYCPGYRRRTAPKPSNSPSRGVPLLPNHRQHLRTCPGPPVWHRHPYHGRPDAPRYAVALNVGCPSAPPTPLSIRIDSSPVHRTCSMGYLRAATHALSHSLRAPCCIRDRGGRSVLILISRAQLLTTRTCTTRHHCHSHRRTPYPRTVEPTSVSTPLLDCLAPLACRVSVRRPTGPFLRFASRGISEWWACEVE